MYINICYVTGIQELLTDAIKADMAIKNAILKRTTIPDSPVPSPYVPADVIVTVPVTELPVTVRILPHYSSVHSRFICANAVFNLTASA